MSGFEIAGLVLGAIPLIIEALEKYEKTYLTAQKWRYYRRELRSIVENLENERVRFQNACESLLDGLDLDSQMESLVEDLSNPAWKGKDIQAKIHARLGRSYIVFERNVRDMEAAVEEMKRRLDLQANGKVGWMDASFLSRELKRVSFVLKRSRYADLMTTIELCITKIEHEIHGNTSNEPRRKVKFQVRLTKLIREVSGSLYRALRHSFPCNCFHQLQLSLTLPTVGQAYKTDDDIIRELEFPVVLTYNLDKDTSNSFKQHQTMRREEVSIQVCYDEKSCDEVAPVGVSEEVSNTRGTKRKGVTFAPQDLFKTPRICLDQSATMTLVQNSLLSTNTPATIGFTEKLNLCHRIRGSQKKRAFDSYGLISDKDHQSPLLFSVQPKKILPPDINDEGSWSIVSLRQILERPREFPRAGYPARLHLGAVIPSTFLQLYQTAWLPHALTSEEILFFYKGSEVQYGHPFVVRSLPENTEWRPPFDPDRNGCPELKSLGILLLESNLGKTFESLRDKYEKDNSKEAFEETSHVTDDDVVRNLMLRRENWDGNYAEVVKLCLWGGAGRQLDLNNEAFRHEIYERVVAPLESDLRSIRWTFNG